MRAIARMSHNPGKLPSRVVQNRGALQSVDGLYQTLEEIAVLGSRRISTLSESRKSVLNRLHLSLQALKKNVDTLVHQI